MKAHGGYAPPQLHRREEAESWTTPGIRGFRTLFGAMEPGEAFHGYGLDSDAARARTGALLEKLAARMRRPYAWPQAAAAGIAPEDNPAIPSGYTYLAQFAAHDLSFLGSTVSSIDDPLLDQRNLRTVVLNLDTMYGAGPLDRPSAYGLPPDRRGPRNRLRLGRTRLRATDGTTGAPNGPLRDLPRVGCPHLDAGNEAAGLTDVLIPDPRNDAHALVGQMLVAFHLLHNAVIDALKSHVGPDGAPPSAERGFFLARGVVVAAFRSVVEHDLLRRLLNPVVHRYYTEGGRLLDPDGSNRMPVEFSHAALRIGHAMIRPSYQLNDEARFGLREVLSTNSNDLPGSMPLSASWLVRWSKFFEIDGAPPANLARRLSPYTVPTLCDGALVGLDSGAQPGGLPMRDLMRGASAFMRSVDSLIAHVPARFKRDVPLLADAEHRRSAIREWLQEGGADFSDEDLEVLARDPPLVFFLLFEAARTEGGLRLGRLGSIILAEVFFRALRTEEADAGVRDAAAFVFPAGVPTTMPALLAFIAAQPAVAGQTVPFL